MSENKRVEVSSSQFLVFTSEANGSIEVRYEDGTIWLTQKLMAQLFGVDVRTISEHLRNIYNSAELEVEATVRNFRIVRSEGSRQVTRNIDHYNLDAIISVGYRVNSVQATQFRQWATKVLRDFTLRGYVIDRARMEQGEILGVDYFEQLLEEIREIRLSERRFYQKVTDIFATAVDYDSSSPLAKRFFATVQNKMHYAVHGHTAAELIKQRADASLPHMGLTSWKNSPDGKILRSDVTIGKNYLTAKELKELGTLVEAYLNLAESRARRQITTTMENWVEFLDQVLTLDAREILDNAGTISKKMADDYALREFAEFRKIQDARYVSDFDRFAAEAHKAIDAGNDDAH
ncbi:virulence RhuM family protein [Schaalia sp. lx-100]|uniref:virulence RhuM family protein n=1 Tax=Schaalia sp. lx-100 TaxID=2899081 RepID=UPI001E50BE47|nr:virulence RhuM family protein [Schaalia sp. lx-100]MCD4557755.1 virulence RhuM family protein [Schaalia sp. lx-100]